MEHSTRSSKVTVEYTDLSGIYPVISDDLRRHLPLRNLYWHSTSRPLRSIASLYIDLVKAGTQGNEPASLEKHDSAAQIGADASLDHGLISQSGGQRNSGGNVKKERRHQIPGLRRTPYLKILFLRCSDVESYKATHRAQIREWVKDNTPPAQSSAVPNAHEFHDAFEWLIVHVVLPDDGRSISRSSNASRSEFRNGNRGSDAVIEKLRADFNGASKTAVDRVAQVRIQRKLENIQISGQDSDTSAGWAEFILKAKSLILSSFDLRVTQYEEDIKEKEAQRNVPGWNFNTFFLLKEGLARGFESVGLIEDAMSGYQELAAGLTSVVEHGHNGQQEDHFKDYTDDIAAELKRALQSDIVHPGNATNGSPVGPSRETDQASDEQFELGSNILDPDRKPFRELILANEISVFDFRCYLFAREVSLLLRLANVLEPFDSGSSSIDIGAESVHVTPKAPKRDAQDLLLLAGVCRRALDFFASTARLMRDDLRRSIDPLSKVHTTAGHSLSSSFQGPIEDLVASWTYSACQCILKVTDVPSLTDQLQALLRTSKPSQEVTSNTTSPGTTLSPEGLPRRSSSLPVHISPPPEQYTPDRIPVPTGLDVVRLLPPKSPQTGTAELAAQRAELVALKRQVLAGVGTRSNYIRFSCVTFNDLPIETTHDTEDVSFDDVLSVEDGRGTEEKALNENPVSSLRNMELRNSLSSEQAYIKAYEDLTLTALGLNVIAEKRRSAESLTADLARIRFGMKDYSNAASYFHQLASFYYNNDWARLELPMLDMYAQSLKNLSRTQEFIRAGLQILAKATRQGPMSFFTKQDTPHVPGGFGHYLRDIIKASESLEGTISAPLGRHFGNVSLEPYIQHFKERDGFQLSLELESLMPEAFEAHSIRVKLVSVNEEQRCNIWLGTETRVYLRQGPNRVIIQTTMTCTGWYKLERVELRSGNISLVSDVAVPTGNALFGASPVPDGANHMIEWNSSPILVYPKEKALEAQITLHRSIHLGQPRLLELEISSGQNEVSRGRVNLRACSAGLRLHMADSKVISGNNFGFEMSQAGTLGFDDLRADAKFVALVPYALENELTEIKVKTEVFYTVADRDYHYIRSSEISVQLQLSVNVQDSFQEQALFSNFKIGTASSTPARVHGYSMLSTNAYQVALPPVVDNVLGIYPRQPLSLVAKIQRKASSTQGAPTKNASDRLLLLQIRYACLDQEVNVAVADALSTALHESKFRGKSRLLVDALTKTLRSQLSTQDLESIGLLRQIPMAAFQDYNWDSVLAGLKPEERAEIEPWLIQWHLSHNTIELPREAQDGSLLDLIVPVEVPHIPVIVTAQLDILSSTANSGATHVVAADQSLLAEASLRYSCYWANESDDPSQYARFDITYEFQANQDDWLIGGQRKVHYCAKVGETWRFPVILLPQKSGHLQYPSLEVRITKTQDDKTQAGDSKGTPRIEIACEIDYLNQAEKILVVPSLSQSTVSLDTGSSGDRAWLLESRSR